MHNPLETIEAAALQLSHADRSHLATTLLASLEEDDEIFAAWVVEAEQRLDALEKGGATEIAVTEVFAAARAGLSRGN